MTAGARLVALSGGSPRSAGQRLSELAAGPAAGVRMVARSGLSSATAAVHLMHDPITPGPGDAPKFVGFIMNMGALMSRA